MTLSGRIVLINLAALSSGYARVQMRYTAKWIEENQAKRHARSSGPFHWKQNKTKNNQCKLLWFHNPAYDLRSVQTGHPAKSTFQIFSGQTITIFHCFSLCLNLFHCQPNMWVRAICARVFFFPRLPRQSKMCKLRYRQHNDHTVGLCYLWHAAKQSARV